MGIRKVDTEISSGYTKSVIKIQDGIITLKFQLDTEIPTGYTNNSMIFVYPLEFSGIEFVYPDEISVSTFVCIPSWHFSIEFVYLDVISVSTLYKQSLCTQMRFQYRCVQIKSDCSVSL